MHTSMDTASCKGEDVGGGEAESIRIRKQVSSQAERYKRRKRGWLMY